MEIERTRAAVEQAERLAKEIDEIRIPPQPRAVVQDITPEALATRLCEQGGRLLLFSPEGGGDLFEMASRYSRSGGANINVYLKAHAGEGFWVDRKGKDSPSERVEDPALTMCIAVQPGVLQAIDEDHVFRKRGLMGRFLYAAPDSLVGHRPAETPAMSPEVKTAYEANAKRIHQWTPDAPLTLTLAEGARRLVLEFHDEIERRQRPGGDLAHVSDWAGKVVGAAARLAGILHLAESLPHGPAIPATIPARTVESAIALARYYIDHALIVYRQMGADRAVEDALYVLDWIVRTRQTDFKKRDAQQALRSFHSAADIQGALDVLEEHRFVRAQPTATPGAKGRPSDPVYLVNPRAADFHHRAGPGGRR